jgi:hypothetical protein
LASLYLMSVMQDYNKEEGTVSLAEHYTTNWVKFITGKLREHWTPGKVFFRVRKDEWYGSVQHGTLSFSMTPDKELQDAGVPSKSAIYVGIQADLSNCGMVRIHWIEATNLPVEYREEGMRYALKEAMKLIGSMGYTSVGYSMPARFMNEFLESILKECGFKEYPELAFVNRRSRNAINQFFAVIEM